MTYEVIGSFPEASNATPLLLACYDGLQVVFPPDFPPGGELTFLPDSRNRSSITCPQDPLSRAPFHPVRHAWGFACRLVFTLTLSCPQKCGLLTFRVLRILRHRADASCNAEAKQSESGKARLKSKEGGRWRCHGDEDAIRPGV